MFVSGAGSPRQHSKLGGNPCNFFVRAPLCDRLGLALGCAVGLAARLLRCPSTPTPPNPCSTPTFIIHHSLLVHHVWFEIRGSPRQFSTTGGNPCKFFFLRIAPTRESTYHHKQTSPSLSQQKSSSTTPSLSWTPALAHFYPSLPLRAFKYPPQTQIQTPTQKTLINTQSFSSIYSIPPLQQKHSFSHHP